MVSQQATTPLGHDGQENAHTHLFDKHCLLRFLMTWIACAVTPICIGIVQAFKFNNFVVQVGIACDVFFLFDINKGRSFFRLVRLFHKLTNRISGLPKIDYTKRFPKNREHLPLLMPVVGAMLPLLLPILAKILGASDLLQAWLTVFRLIRLRDLLISFHSLKNRFPNVVALRNNTINRCLLIAVFTSIYATTLASIWFYLSCRRLNECSSDEDSWVGSDSVLREKNIFSIYIRSMHFIIQTLFTVGYGKAFQIQLF